MISLFFVPKVGFPYGPYGNQPQFTPFPQNFGFNFQPFQPLQPFQPFAPIQPFNQPFNQPLATPEEFNNYLSDLQQKYAAYVLIFLAISCFCQSFLNFFLNNQNVTNMNYCCYYVDIEAEVLHSQRLELRPLQALILGQLST